jgi:hypothetical protein
MTPPAYITTSWDDGHPLDFRVAELLAKHGLPGTFYIPRVCDRDTMTAAQVGELSRTFEVGAHTVHHVVLTEAADDQAAREIAYGKAWVEDTTGQPCTMFCPPRGKYSRRHLDLVRLAGYRGVRGVELLSVDPPRAEAGLLVLPTTVQAHPHGLGAFARNLARRAAFRNLWLFLLHGRTTDWLTLARSLVGAALRRGGVFHLWGHSWELEETGQWQRLEEVLRFLADHTPRAAALTNGQVCQALDGGSLRVGQGLPCRC